MNFLRFIWDIIARFIGLILLFITWLRLWGRLLKLFWTETWSWHMDKYGFFSWYTLIFPGEMIRLSYVKSLRLLRDAYWDEQD